VTGVTGARIAERRRARAHPVDRTSGGRTPGSGWAHLCLARSV